VAVNSAGTSFGGDVTFVAAVPPPVITQASNQFLVVGQTLVITNQAQTVLPPVTWSLASSDPTNVVINATNGVLSWTPACVQGSSTNSITVWATDSGSPPWSNSMTFVVTNSDCVQVGLGSTVMQTGTTSSVPITLISSLALTNLSFGVVYPASRFTNWVVALSNSAIGTTIVQPISGTETWIDFEANPGESFQAPANIGALYFAALPGLSGFVPLGIANIAATEQGGVLAGNTNGQGGLVVLIGPQPLLDAWIGSNSTRMLTLYGNPGTNYQLLYNTNLVSTNWQALGSVLMTNLAEYLIINQTGPRVYIRAR
jgi:hypothetical protein